MAMNSCDNRLEKVNDCKTSIPAHFATTMSCLHRFALVILVLLSCFLASCATHTGTGALAGAGIGAAAGSTIGKDKKRTLEGTIIGAAFGATIGAVLDANKNSRRTHATPASTQNPPARTPTVMPPRQRSWPASQARHTNPQPPPKRISPPPPSPKKPTPRTPPGSYPVARKTNEHGIVVSPHSPYKKVNVRNFSPGAVAVDPSSNRRFRVP